MAEAPFEVRDRRLFTPPNLLSLLRLALLPPTLLALHRQEAWGLTPVLVLLAVGMGTDAVDGLLARRRGWISDVGRILDPLADKVYLGGVLLYLAWARGFPVWLVGLVLARDVTLVSATALLVRRHRVAFAANRWGKASTVLLTVLAFVYVLRLEEAAPWLVVATAATIVASAIAYALSVRAFLRGPSAHPTRTRPAAER